MVLYQRKLYFSKDPERSNIFQGGGGGVAGSLEAVWSGLIDWFDSLCPINVLSVI